MCCLQWVCCMLVQSIRYCNSNMAYHMRNMCHDLSRNCLHQDIAPHPGTYLLSIHYRIRKLPHCLHPLRNIRHDLSRKCLHQDMLAVRYNQLPSIAHRIRNIPCCLFPLRNICHDQSKDYFHQDTLAVRCNQIHPIPRCMRNNQARNNIDFDHMAGCIWASNNPIQSIHRNMCRYR